MSSNLINTLLLALCFLALFVIGEILFHKCKVNAEWTRKIVHIITGLLSLLFPIMLTSHWYVLLLCSSFAIILIISLRFNLLKSINGIRRKSYGSMYYPLSVYICFLFTQWFHEEHPESWAGYMIYYLPILLLAICDPIAALVGSKKPIVRFAMGDAFKSIGGAMGFFISALILTSLAFYLSSVPFAFSTILAILMITLSTMIAEFISRNGLDNLLIPIVGSLTAYVSLVYIIEL